MTVQVSSRHPRRALTSVSVRAQCLAALLFGVIILFAVGFSPIGAVHDAAHDSRHSLSFPCH